MVQAVTATLSNALQEAIDEVPPRAFSDAAFRMQALENGVADGAAATYQNYKCEGHRNNNQ